MASSSSSSDLIKTVAQLLRRVPVAEQEALLAGWTQETLGVVQTRAGKETGEGSATSQIRKRKAPSQGEEGSRKKKDVRDNEGLNPGTSSEERLTKQKVIPDLLIDETVLNATPNKVVGWLNECQKWGHLFKNMVEGDEDLIRDFYGKLSIASDKDTARAKVVTGGIEWEFSDKEVGEILGVPRDGVTLFPGGTWPEDRCEVLELVFRNPDKEVEGLRDSEMNASARAVHQIVVRGLTPRLEDTSCVTAHDAYIMASILKGEPVHLPLLMMKHMETCIQDKSLGLPFPGLVKKLLSNAGFYRTRREVPLVHRFDVSLLGRMEQVNGTEVHEEVQRLSDRVEDLHGKYDEILFWVKTIAAEFSPELKEEMNEGMNSDDAHR